MQHGFLLSRRMLARQSGTKQIIMITDGEPTAHLLPDGEVFFNYPPVQATVDVNAQRGGAVHAGGHPHQHVHARRQRLPQGVRREAHAAEPGRAFFTTPETLGDDVLVDFIEQKRACAAVAAARPDNLSPWRIES